MFVEIFKDDVDDDGSFAAFQDLAQIDALIISLQKERAAEALYLLTNGSSPEPDLTKLYAATNAHLASVRLWPNAATLVTSFTTRDQLGQSLAWKRSNVTVDDSTVLNGLIFYTTLTRTFIQWASTALWLFGQTDGLWQTETAYVYLLKAQDEFGIQLALGSEYFDNSVTLTAEEHQFFTASAEIGSVCVNVSMNHDAETAKTLNDGFYSTYNATNVQELVNVVLANDDRTLPSSNGTNLGAQWYQSVSPFISLISNARESLLTKMLNNVQHERGALIGYLVRDVIGLLISLALAPILALALRCLTGALGAQVADIIYKQSQLKFEKRKTEDLLYQMLPKQVALQLRMHGKVAAESFDAVTVMFSDIKNFADISNISTPMQIVNTLNAIYTHIDSKIEKHDVYKV